MKVVGEAYTVRNLSRDGTAVYLAASKAPKDAILVIERGHDKVFASVNQQVVLIARARGIRGIVVDGMVGNIKEIGELDFPIFSMGSSPAGCACLGLAGEVQIPIVCGDVPIKSRQIIFADDNGVLELPDELETIICKAEEEIKITKELQEKMKKEENYIK